METCNDNVHYKIVDNRLWYLMGRYVEPESGNPHPNLPEDNDRGRNAVGNVYEALVGLLWLEGNTQSLTHIFLTLMDLDQLEYPEWHAPQRRSSTGFLRGALARRCSEFVFVLTERSYGYANGRASRTLGAVAEPRGPWIQKPGNILHIPEWKDGYDGPLPGGWAPPPPPPRGSPRAQGTVDKDRWARRPTASARAAATATRTSTAGPSTSLPGQAAARSAAGPLPVERREPRCGRAHFRGGPQEGAGPGPRTQGEWRTSVQSSLEMPQEGPCPDLTRKYYMFFNEGSQAPRPDPDKDCVLFKFAKEGETIFARRYPRSKWPRSNGALEGEF